MANGGFSVSNVNTPARVGTSKERWSLGERDLRFLKVMGLICVSAALIIDSQQAKPALPWHEVSNYLGKVITDAAGPVGERLSIISNQISSHLHPQEPIGPVRPFCVIEIPGEGLSLQEKLVSWLGPNLKPTLLNYGRNAVTNFRELCTIPVGR